MMDYFTLASYALGGGIGLLALRELRVLAVARNKSKMQLVKLDAEKTAKFQGISAILENSDQLLTQLFVMRKEQFDAGRKQGLSEQQIAIQLKGIDTRIMWIQRMASNKQWLQYVAPYADKLVETALLMVNRWMKSA